MLKIIFICTGNTCRSPMAAAFLHEKIKECGQDDGFEVMSAGIAAGGVFPASNGAYTVMQLSGIDLANHRSRQVTPELIQNMDLVIAMTSGHKRMICDMAPDAKDRVYTLGEYAGEICDIPDPYGGSIGEYQVCAEEIKKLIAKVWQRLQFMQEKKHK